MPIGEIDKIKSAQAKQQGVTGNSAEIRETKEVDKCEIVK